MSVQLRSCRDYSIRGLLAGLLLVLPVAAWADSGVQCSRALSLDGQLAQGADPKAVAKACLAAAAKGGNAQMLYLAGLVLEQGIGGSRDSVKAEDWYRRAAGKGQPLAQLAMGRLAEARADHDAALAWYGAAAQKRNSIAEAALMRLKIADPSALWPATEQALVIDDSLGTLAELAGSGSGIVLDDHLVLTNEHVVAQCDRVAVAPGLPARVLAKDAERDLAVLRTGVRPGAIASLAIDPAIGPEDKLFTGGYPGAEKASPSFMMTEGRRSTRDLGAEAAEFWLLSNQIGPGNSGGPLLDASGLVRGVVFASLPVTGIVKKSAPKGGKEGMAIRLDTVKAFLEQHDIAYHTATAGPVPPGDAARMKDHVADITVLVACFMD